MIETQALIFQNKVNMQNLTIVFKLLNAFNFKHLNRIKTYQTPDAAETRIAC